MKLAVIINVWYDSIEHLKHSIQLIIDHVDVIIIMDQTISNRFESISKADLKTFESELNIVIQSCRGKRVISKCYVPKQSKPMHNEIDKRSEGLEIAKRENCTHFFHMDSDEYWPDFSKAKEQFIKSGAAGSVCLILTYFKRPTLRLKERDGYHVPFIHRLTNQTHHSMKYPYWVDPTRRVNESNIIELDIDMHHMSWIRNNIMLKIRNSSAPFDLNGEHIQDYNRDLKGGDFIKCYSQELIEVDDQFNISHIGR